MADADALPEITGPIPDMLLGGGLYPSVEADLEYMAGGIRDVPLVGQTVLSRSIDDLSRDLGWEVYETMMHDATVASAVFVLITGILNGEGRVLARHALAAEEELDRGTPEHAGRIADIDNAHWARGFVERQLHRLKRPYKQTLFELLYGMVYGAKLAEKVFEPGDGEDAGLCCLKRIRAKRQQAWEFVVTPYGDLVGIRGLIVGGGVADFPPQKFMILTWMPQDGDPRGRSILRPSYNGWFLKVNCLPKLFKYLDRFGTPITIGKTPPLAPDDYLRDRDGNPIGPKVSPTRQLSAELQRLEGGASLAVPSGTEVDFYTPAGNGEAFLHAIEIFKREILEGILMTARSIKEAEHGSKADGEQAEHVVARLIAYGRETAENATVEQLFHHLIELNRGKAFADRYTPSYDLGVVEDKDVAEVLTAWTRAGYAAAPEHFPVLDQRFGVPPRKAREVGEPIPKTPEEKAIEAKERAKTDAA